jgi:hypothetical protein
VLLHVAVDGVVDRQEIREQAIGGAQDVLEGRIDREGVAEFVVLLGREGAQKPVDVRVAEVPRDLYRSSSVSLPSKCFFRASSSASSSSPDRRGRWAGWRRNSFSC